MSRFKRVLAGLSAAILLAIPGCLPQALAADGPTDAMIETAISMEEEYDLPSGLLLAVAEVESSFDPGCRTGRCHGLMQIHSSYASSFAKAAGMDSYDLFDFRDSMRIGAYLLSDYMTRYEGDLHFALMSYNLGEWGAMAKRKAGVDTTSYSRKVVGKIEKYAVMEADSRKTPEPVAVTPDGPTVVEGPSAETVDVSMAIRELVTGMMQLWKVVLAV